jgi:hypothetical protein
LINLRIAELVGAPAPTRVGFKASPIYNNRIVLEQFRLFDRLFAEDNADRERYAARLAFISDALRRNAASSDNKGEPIAYETLEQQQAPKAPMQPPGGSETKLAAASMTQNVSFSDSAKGDEPAVKTRPSTAPRARPWEIPDMVIKIDPVTMQRIEAR